MTYERVSNGSISTVRPWGLVAGCLRALAEAAERHRRQVAKRDELAHLTDALRRDIGIPTPSPRTRGTLPPTMNGRFHLSL